MKNDKLKIEIKSDENNIAIKRFNSKIQCEVKIIMNLKLFPDWLQ